jgi:hypothetical protein
VKPDAKPHRVQVSPRHAAFVSGAVNFSGVLHLSDNQVFLASAPGTAIGALGLRWAIKNSQRQWFARTAFGLNAVVSLLGHIPFLYDLAGRPSA